MREVRLDTNCYSNGKVLYQGLLVLLCLVCGRVGSAMELGEDTLNIYATATTDYVFRGVSYNAEDPTLHLSLDYQNHHGWFGGIWMSQANFYEEVDVPPDTLPEDIHGGGNDRGIEIDYYLGYSHYLDASWSVSASYVYYSYLGLADGNDYDYSEWIGSLSYSDFVTAEFSWSPESLDTENSSTTFEITSATSIPGRLTLSGGIGRFWLSDLRGGDYTFWNIGLSRSLGRFAVDVRYHDTDLTGDNIFPSDHGDARMVFSLSTGI